MKIIGKQNLLRILKVFFVMQAMINLIGALGPEISFDALYYHLPISRLMAERGWWGVVPGGLLYMSGLPKGMEVINALLLRMGNVLGMNSPESLAALLHYLMGLGSAALIYRIARRYLDELGSWSAVILWYSNLVVGWQSMVVYVDLTKTFFELIVVWYLLEWFEEGSKFAWLKAAVAMGITYSVKVLSGFDIVFLMPVIIYYAYKNKDYWRMVGYGLLVGIFVLFWGIINMIQGYNYFYTYGSKIPIIPAKYVLSGSRILSPIYVFFHPEFRTGPYVLILLIIGWEKIKKYIRPELLIMVFMLFLSWWYAPLRAMKGEGRYFLVVLGLMYVIGSASVQVKKGWKRNIVLGVVLVSGVVGIVYRGYANLKYVPYLLGWQSKEQFLIENLKFDFGDWYDVGDEVSDVVGDKRYIVYGVHNTYYLPGNFDHESFSDNGYCYEYVLVKDGSESVPPDLEELEVVSRQEIAKSILYRRNCVFGENEVLR